MGKCQLLTSPVILSFAAKTSPKEPHPIRVKSRYRPLITSSPVSSSSSELVAVVEMEPDEVELHSEFFAIVLFWTAIIIFLQHNTRLQLVFDLF